MTNTNTGHVNTGNWNTGDMNTGNWNTGDRNTGDMNTGNQNTGHRNTGDMNTGNRNTGYMNTGYWNTGYMNTGYWNTGDMNTGHRNTGDMNTGNRNTGNWNTGHWNTGDMNTGDRNTGDMNTGHRNTGDMNTGNRNTGNWNTGNWNTGYMNTVTPKDCLMFNKTAKREDWYNAEKPRWIYVDLAEWVREDDMTEKEKEAYPSYITTGGYLKSYSSLHHAYIEAWEKASKEDKELTFKLPNFDIEVFKEIFGFTPIIDDKVECIIDGQKLMLSRESVDELKKLK